MAEAPPPRRDSRAQTTSDNEAEAEAPSQQEEASEKPERKKDDSLLDKTTKELKELNDLDI